MSKRLRINRFEALELKPDADGKRARCRRRQRAVEIAATIAQPIEAHRNRRAAREPSLG